MTRRDPHIDCRFRYDQMVEFLSGWRTHADMLFTLLNEERAATSRVRDEHPRQRYDFNSCTDVDCCNDPALWVCARCEVEYPCDTINALNGHTSEDFCTPIQATSANLHPDTASPQAGES